MLTMNSSMQSQAVASRVEPSSELSSGDTARIQAEYVEMPGLSLTARQAARLWGLDRLRSEQVLSRLVNSGFLQCDRHDVLGPIFDDIAHVDWPTHLPLMYDFWESVLFGTATFKGAPLEAHRALARRTPLTSGAFDRWIALFHQTVDDLFAGFTANHAKQSASQIALVLQHHIAADRGAELTNAS